MNWVRGKKIGGSQQTGFYHPFVCAFLATVLCTLLAASVTAQEIVRLAVLPDTVELDIDETFVLIAEATLSSGDVVDVSEIVQWGTSDTSVAIVSNGAETMGEVTALSAGEAWISVRDPITGVASYQSGNDSVVRVIGGLISLRVTPSDRRIDLGETKSMTAIGTFSDETTRDVTDQVFWTSSNPNVVEVVSNRGKVTAVGSGVAFISARSANGVSSSNSGGDGRIRVSAVLESIRVVPSDVQLAVGFSRSFDAEGSFRDGSTDDISNDVEWSSSDASVAKISNESGNQGEVFARKKGTAVIRAVDPESGISSSRSGGDAVVTVAGPVVGLSISPSDSELPVGESRAFSARVELEDGSFFSLPRRSVEWTSSNPRVATVSNESSTAGVVTALAEGDTILSALDPVTGLRSTDSDGDTRLTVVPTLFELESLQVTPSDRSIDLGETKSMTATGIFRRGETADLTDHVVWTSSDPSVVVVSNDEGSRGRATGRATGVALISATVPGVVSSSDSGMDGRVRVLAELLSIRVVPGNVQLPIDFSRSLDAEGTFRNGSVADISNKVDWFTSDSSVVTVSNEPDSRGDIAALARGVVSIRAVDPSTGVSSSDSDGNAMVTVGGRAVALSISPSDSELPTGLSRTFSIDATLEDGSLFGLSRRSVQWTSSDPAVATVSNDPSAAGLVTALTGGETWISAVHPLTGLRSADSDGDARLTVVPALEEIVSLEVTPSDRSIDLGESKSMTATGVFPGGATADLSDHVVWSSSDPAVVVVSNDAGTRGRATAMTLGVAFISATIPGVISSSDSEADGRVRVLAQLVSIRVTPSTVRIPVGSGRSLDAKGTFHDGSVADISNKVSWLTSDSSVALVSNESGNQGELTTLKTGIAVVSVVDPETGISSTASGGDALVEVRGQIVGLSVRPSDEQLPVGASRTFSVRATLEDGSFLGLSRSSVEWTSSNPAVATVGNESSTAGLVTAASTGETFLSVVYPLNGISSTESGGDARLTVPGRMVAIEVRPRERDLFIGQTKRFSVFARLDTGAELKLSEDVQFTSSDPLIATVTNGSGKRGDTTGLAAGTATIWASHLPSGLSSATTGGDATAVVSGRVQTMRVDPPRAFYPVGTEEKLKLRAALDDGSTSNIASDAIWTSSDPSVVEIGTESPNKGVLIAKSFGTVTISALEPVSGVTTTASGGDGIITVVEGINGLSVRGGDLGLRTGDRPRLRAFGEFTNLEPLPGETERIDIELTDRVEWASSDLSVIRIEDGRALAVGLGSASVSAYDPELQISSTAYGGDAAFRVVATLKGLVIKPKKLRMRVDAKRPRAFKAIGHFTDGARLVLTDRVEFATEDATVARVSNEVGTQGEVAPVAPGKTGVTAVDPITSVSAKRSRRVIIRKSKR